MARFAAKLLADLRWLLGAMVDLVFPPDDE